jgi:hypothetical protein
MPRRAELSMTNLRTLQNCTSLGLVLLLQSFVVVFGQLASGNATDPQENRPTGSWRDYFPYHRTEELVHCQGISPETSFWAVRTEQALFLYHESDNSLERLTTVEGMSGSNPTAIAWDANNEVLIVGYASGKLDLFSNTGEWLYTFNDIPQSNLIGDKSVLNILWGGNDNPDMIFAACGFGVVALNIRTLDVRDTWYVEGQQNLRRCNGISVHQQAGSEAVYVVWTDAGIFEAPVNHPFLSSPEAWTRWSDIPLETASYMHVIFAPDGDVVVHMKTEDPASPDALWLLDQGLWTAFPNWEEGIVLDLEATQINDENQSWRLAIADFQSIRLYNEEWEQVQLDYAADGIPLRVRDMAFKNGSTVNGNEVVESFQDLFIANNEQGLLKMDITGEERDDHWVLDGPPVPLVRDIDAWNDRVWIASGGIDGTWTSMYHKHGLYGFEGNDWKWIELGDGENNVMGINDPMCASIDPLNPDHAYFGTWEEGLIEVLDNEVVNVFNDANSPLQQADFGGSARIGVGGVDFDALGNLWFTNAYAEEGLHVRLQDGSFQTMGLGDALGNDGWLGQVLAARNGYIWCIMPRNQGLLVYDTNKTPQDTNDDDWRVLTADPEKGGLPSDDVYSIEEDLDGEIWVGTAAGPCVIYLPSLAFENDNDNPIASQILIQQDGNFQLLLETEIIQSICIDGGNRKWLGTQNSGVYLLSSDGTSEVLHFEAENSPLPSDQIFDIAINHRNGEVLFGTDRGLIGWRSDAQNFVVEISEIRAYPNPVTADFDGWITIDGLAYESTVHITSSSGRSIAKIDSQGGRAVWNGLDWNGQQAGYGIYLVFATDAEGNSAGTTKFAIMR